MLYRLTEYFGWLNVWLALAGLVALPFGLFETTERYETLLMIGVMLAVIASSIVYASKQKRMGTDIGVKAYPATLVAYLLFGLFVYRWLVFG